jgi:hypothetical protein
MQVHSLPLESRLGHEKVCTVSTKPAGVAFSDKKLHVAALTYLGCARHHDSENQERTMGLPCLRRIKQLFPIRYTVVKLVRHVPATWILPV